jgi:hypothetical protein
MNSMANEGATLRMEPTLQAVLGRFSGDRIKAIDYCTAMAVEYPQLAKEYWSIKQALEMRKAAHV